ncbi:hypothetical protein EDF68_1341 [Ochrobactrum sp. BH3]|uniref:hypothetical protein n=1 Tax=Brucella pituitosa TaxID=571256 RepID=UPI001042D18E|nr:hypothetical protein EDF68_1341 [Ochrobactrum sp. BH3]
MAGPQADTYRRSTICQDQALSVWLTSRAASVVGLMEATRRLACRGVLVSLEAFYLSQVGKGELKSGKPLKNRGFSFKNTADKNRRASMKPRCYFAA